MIGIRLTYFICTSAVGRHATGFGVGFGGGGGVGSGVGGCGVTALVLAVMYPLNGHGSGISACSLLVS